MKRPPPPGRVFAALVLAALLMCGQSAPAAAQTPSSTGVHQSDHPLIAPLMRPGRDLDATKFTHRRAVRLYPSGAGVSRFALSPGDLAAAAADLSDLRIVDAENRQRPYVLERVRQERMVVAVRRQDAAVGSAFELVLPVAPLTVDRVEVELGQSHVERAFRLIAHRDDRAHDVVRGDISRRPNDERATVQIDLPRPLRADGFTLVVADGDDAPLPITSAAITITSADLYVLAPTGSYTLLVGRPELSPPRYELAGLRAQVLAAPAGEVHAGPLEPNPRHRPHLESKGAPKPDSSLLLWASIIAAAILLGALTLHAARTPAPN